MLVPAPNSVDLELRPLLFTHPAHVHVFLLPAVPGVRDKYAESGAFSRTDLEIWYPPAAAAACFSRRALALPGTPIISSGW
jgi:hypothetical protein